MRKKRNRSHRSTSVKSVKQQAQRMGLTAVCFVVISGCQTTDSLSSGSSPAGLQQSQGQVVQITRLAKQKIGDIPEVAADVLSSLQADIVPQSSGTVEQLFKRRGDTVNKGDILFKISSPELIMKRERALLAVREAVDAMQLAKREESNAKAELNNNIIKAEMQLQAAQKKYNKVRNNYDIGVATKSEVEKVYSDLQNLEMDLELLRLKSSASGDSQSISSLEIRIKEAVLSLEEVEQQIEGLEVRASLDGVLAELELEEGMPLSGGVRVGHIIHTDHLKLRALLNEQAFQLVQGKTELSFYQPNTTQKWKAKVTYVANFINPETKGYEINLQLDNSSKQFKPGMKVLLQLAEESEQMVVAVPSSSILREGDNAYVFVLNEESKAEKRKIQIGRVNEPNYEVISGVQEGEKLIISGHRQLKDQDPVRLATAEVPQ
jgi:HlyD family secretion protein